MICPCGFDSYKIAALDVGGQGFISAYDITGLAQFTDDIGEYALRVVRALSDGYDIVFGTVERSAYMVAHTAVYGDISADARYILHRADFIYRDRRFSCNRAAGFYDDVRHDETVL